MASKAALTPSNQQSQRSVHPFDEAALRSLHTRLALIVTEMSVSTLTDDPRYGELAAERTEIKQQIGLLLNSEQKTRYFNAQTERQAAHHQIADIDKQLASATGSASDYSRLTSERQGVLIEVERLDRLMPGLKAAYDAQLRIERDVNFHYRAELQRSKNGALAIRIRTELARISTDLRRLLKDVAAAALETDSLNSELPAGEPYVLDANALARGRPSMPREVVSEVEKSLWVFEATGRLVGNQDEVVPVDAFSGRLGVHDARCAKRPFKVTTYLPEQRSQTAEPLFELISIPNFDGPGASFIGDRHSALSASQIDAEAPSVPRLQRDAQIEMTPTSDWRGGVIVTEHRAAIG